MTVLYTGLNPPREPHIIHCPFIEVSLKPLTDPIFAELKKVAPKTTHLVFTSKTAVEYYFSLPFASPSLPCYAVGESTKKTLQRNGVTQIMAPEEETAEGLVALLDKESLRAPFFLWPHSSLSRTVLSDFFRKKEWDFYECALYHTTLRLPDPLPPLDQFEEVIFTSPSTVDSFFHAYGHFPDHLIFTPIGPVTAKRLEELQRTPGVCKN